MTNIGVTITVTECGDIAESSRPGARLSCLPSTKNLVTRNSDRFLAEPARLENSGPSQRLTVNTVTSSFRGTS
jgi:hypothetical protein